MDIGVALGLISGGGGVALVTRGNPVMLETMVLTSARDMGLDSSLDSTMPSTPFFRECTLFGLEPRTPVGTVQMQSIPDERVSMRILPGDNNDDLKAKVFQCFCDHFFGELDRLGFFASPDVYGIIEGKWCAL